MKHFYFLFTLMVAQIMFAQQHHISEVGTPVDSLETINIIKVDPINEDTSLSDANFNLSAGIESGPIIIQDSDFVGATKGQFSVSLNGSAIYNLPIDVPPGINGMKPEVGLVYDSQSGNGIAGYGWNISGLSTISKVGSNKYYDGKNSAINYSSDDRFMLDGQRLLLKSGVYGMDGTEYQTENFTNLKITSHGSPQSNYGPEYFKVQYPSGNIAYYGRQYLGGGITKINTVYALTYITTPQNVVITYSYINDNKNLLISRISYGFRSTNPLSNLLLPNTTNYISFTYKDRYRREIGYVAGETSYLTKVLDKITVRGYAENYRTYQLTYKNTSLRYEQLQKVTETSGDGTLTKSPVTFSYGADPTQNLITHQPSAPLQSSEGSLSNLTSFNTKTIPGDFSGSGKLGYLLYHTTINDGSDEEPHKQETKGDVLRIFDPGSSTLTSRYFSQHFNEVVATKTLNFNNILLPNQGFTTITKRTTIPINNSFQYKFDSFIFIPEYVGQMAMTSTKNFNLRNYGLTRDYYISGDFNGDGISEIIRTEYPGNYKDNTFDRNNQVEIIDLKNDAVHNNQTLPIGFSYFVIDVDADGYDEFVVVRHQRILIHKFNQVSKKLELSQTIVAPDISYTKTNKRPVYIGDFNGDGKIDFVTPKANNNTTWVFYMNKGINFQQCEIMTLISYQQNSIAANNNPFNPFNHNDIYNYIFTDINNDGKTDIVKTKDYFRVNKGSTADYNNRSELWVYENIDFDSAALVTLFDQTYYSFSTPNKQYPLFTVSNFNQKNYKTELAIITDNRLETLKFNKDNVLTQHLKTIDEFDLTTKITYDSYDENKKTINIENPTQSDSEDLVLPFVSFNHPMSVYPKVDIDVAPGFYLVKKVAFNTEKGRLIGGSPDRKQLFSYGDATMSHNGKGFLGFKGRMVTNIYTGGPTIQNLKDQIKNVTIFDVDNNGLVKEEYVAHSTDWANFFTTPVNFLTKKVNTYNVNNLSNKVFKAQNTQSVIIDGLKGIQRTVNSTYDSYSNPLSITEIVTGEGDTSTLNTVLTYNHSLVNDNYYIGRPASNTVKMNNVQTSKEEYTYNNHLLTNVKKHSAIGSAELTEDNQYDIFGNVIQKTISSNDIQPRIANYLYDTTGRYVEKATDNEGLETSYVYNKNKGWLLSQTNPYGHTDSFGYNSFGMVMSETDYLGNTTNYAYKTNSRTLGSTFVRKETNYPDGQKQKITTNGWGNKTYEGYTDIDGNWVGMSYNYDSQDRLIKKSEPYSSTASLFTSFEYDQYGRILKTILPTGRESIASYNGLSSTIDDGVKTKTETKNINNQTKKVVDNGETIHYTYNENGTLRNTNYGGVIISFEYDGWGRKTKMTDPSAGTYFYEYNSIGDLLKEIAPNGITTYTYDVKGKIQSTDFNDTSINYVYNSDKLLDKIVTNTDHGNYEEKFLYDNYKRITGKSYKTPHALTYIYNKTFDELGRVLTDHKAVIGISGQDELKTKNIYKNGYLWKLQNAVTNNDLKVYNSFNERGQVTNFTLANGLITNRSYDQYGYLTQNIVSKNNIQQFNFTNNWDIQRANLKHRSNNLFYGLFNEFFTYDSNDRLTKIDARIVNTLYQPGTEEIQYDGRGRVTYSNVGDYNYDSAKPYQLQNIENLNDLAYYQSNPLQQVTYNTQKAPLSIKQQGKENIYFRYDGFNNRMAMYYGNEGADYTASSKVRYYSPEGDIEVDFDKVSNKYVVTMYVDGDPYTSSIIQRKENNVTALYYLHRDYLGSILAITNSVGTIVEKRHFDAWGNVLLVQDGQNNNLGKLTFLERGYTGHEHLQGVALINMNARLYDPKLHRFLAPDNFIQDPGNPQNYNLYGYGLNNPLRYTDPTGNVWHIVIGAVIGGVVNLTVKAIQGDITSFKDGAVAFGIGAVAGAVGAATGGVAFGLAGGAAGGGGGFLAGAVGGMAGAAFSAPIQSLGNNLYFGDPMMSGKEYLISIAAGGLLGGTVNGGIAAFNGKSFWTGNPAPKTPNVLALSTNPNTSTQSPNTSNALEADAFLTPNQKGELGVQRAIQEEIIEKGGVVLNREVTLEVNGVRVRVDVAADFNGEIILMEVKNGPFSRMTPNQKIAYPEMLDGAAIIPRGANAIPIWGPDQVGKPTTQYILRIIQYGKTE